MGIVHGKVEQNSIVALEYLRYDDKDNGGEYRCGIRTRVDIFGIVHKTPSTAALIMWYIPVLLLRMELLSRSMRARILVTSCWIVHHGLGAPRRC